MDRLKSKQAPVKNPNKHLLDMARYQTQVYRSTTYVEGMYCWTCCHPFSTSPISIPTRVDIDGKYHTYGNFCGFPCASRYLLDGRDYELQSQESTNLLEIMYRDFSGDTHNIRTAPPRLALRCFGGYLDIADYRGETLDVAGNVLNYGYLIHKTLL
jgi:hypothetical protein